MFWSVIAANKRKTYALIFLMGVFLLGTGYAVGMAVAVYNRPMAGLAGLAAAAFIWFVMLMVSLYGSDRVILSISNAKRVHRDKWPQLYNIVEEMKIASSLPKMPEIYIVEDTAPNAFAVGKSPEKCSICVTAGLLAACSRDELQGVVAHEVGHILNRDVMYMTVAATMLGSILLISDMFLRSFKYSPTIRFGSRSRISGAGGAGIIVLVASVFLAIVGPILARILYFSISRKREYLADATSARLTRYPEGLASALEKILKSTATLNFAPSATAPFYIANPYKQHLGGNAFATHPPLSERIRILRAMSAGAGYIDYMKAYIQVTNTRTSLLRASDITDTGRIEIRQASKASSGTELSHGVSRRKAGDIIRAMNNFVFVSCPCGVRIKLPPQYTGNQIRCPRCRRIHDIPETDNKNLRSILTASTALDGKNVMLEDPGQNMGIDLPSSRKQTVSLLPGKWQTFTCNHCGCSHELSPSFSGRRLTCSHCGSRITILQQASSN
ncbi:MAG: M48 family metallopeptidase [Deltaproteobacteria bacterium]|nr:M48 family metallopeptidase [Deltaproteobacteria bacterium]